MTERFTAALVGPPFGLTGRVKIESPSGETSHLLGLKKAVLRKGRGGEKGGVEQEYLIEEVFTAPLSVKFAGIDSPEAARALKGAEILVPREQAAPLNEGEFYIEDLRGLEVIIEGKTVGIISGIIEGGGGFLAEVLLAQEKKRLVPFRNEFFGKVDPAAGQAELLEPWILE
jgi:16S rRNA processing protein RimM